MSGSVIEVFILIAVEVSSDFWDLSLCLSSLIHVNMFHSLWSTFYFAISIYKRWDSSRNASFFLFSHNKQLYARKRVFCNCVALDLNPLLSILPWHQGLLPTPYSTASFLWQQTSGLSSTPNLILTSNTKSQLYYSLSTRLQPPL